MFDKTSFGWSECDRSEISHNLLFKKIPQNGHIQANQNQFCLVWMSP